MATYRSPEEFRDKNKYVCEKGLVSQVTIQRSANYFEPSHPMAMKGESTRSWVGYSLAPMPGCCGVVVSTGAWIKQSQQDCGFGDYFHKERIQFMKDLGYSCAICTTVSGNEKQEAILKKNQWINIHSFKNKRTGNTVLVWIRSIEDSPTMS